MRPSQSGSKRIGSDPFASVRELPGIASEPCLHPTEDEPLYENLHCQFNDPICMSKEGKEWLDRLWAQL